MRVLGIDPGSLRTGWGLVTGGPSDARVVDCGVVTLGSRRPLPDRLATLYRGMEELIRRLEPSTAAVEAPFFGAGARSALQLAHARGVILAALGNAGVEVAEYSPATVKKSVTGSGRADKTQVGRMVVQLLRLSEPPAPHDLSDALAVALCHMTSVRQSVLIDAGARRSRRAASAPE